MERDCSIIYPRRRWFNHPAGERTERIPKIDLKAGETKTVSFTISTEDLRFYNGNLDHTWEPGDFDIMIGPDSKQVQTTRINWTK